MLFYNKKDVHIWWAFLLIKKIKRPGELLWARTADPIDFQANGKKYRSKKQRNTKIKEYKKA